MIRLVDDRTHPWEIVVDGRSRGRVRSLAAAGEFQAFLEGDDADTERERWLETERQRQLDFDEEYVRRHVEERRP